MIKIRCNILNPTENRDIEFLKDYLIVVDNNKIIDMRPYQDESECCKDILDYSDNVLIPGLIDSHVHLAQWNIRGSYKSDLLEWLNTYTFPEENKLKQSQYAKEVAEDFFDNLIANGTTCAAIYVTSSSNATDIAFQVAKSKGYRALIGKIAMDSNCPDYLQESTDMSLRQSIELCEKWDNVDRLNYVFTPRFAPVCTEKLMKDIGSYASKNDKYIQTHLSENHNEIQLVKSLFPGYDSYTDVYFKNHLLTAKTILGHCIHLDDKEIKLIKDTGTKIAHCPDSNFFLKSGRFPYFKLRDEGLSIGLASDVAGGTQLDMFYHMKMANYMQSKSIEVRELFYLATLGNAKVLSKESQIGSIEIGKEADLVVLNINSNASIDEMLAQLIFVNSNNKIKSIFIGGDKLL